MSQDPDRGRRSWPRRTVFAFLVAVTACAIVWSRWVNQVPDVSAVEEMREAIGEELNESLYPVNYESLQVNPDDATLWTANLSDGGTMTAHAVDYDSRSAALWAWLRGSPRWSSSPWHYSSRRVAKVDGLPDDSVFVGFECYNEATCVRWVLWQRVGRGIWVIELFGQSWTAREAFELVHEPD